MRDELERVLAAGIAIASWRVRRFRIRVRCVTVAMLFVPNPTCTSAVVLHGMVGLSTTGSLQNGLDLETAGWSVSSLFEGGPWSFR